MKLTEILKKNTDLASGFTGKPFEIGVISNITVNLIKPVLEYALRLDGIHAVVEIGDYDSVIQDSKRFSEKQVVVVLWETCNLVDGFHNMDNISGIAGDVTRKTENEIEFVFENLSGVPLILVNRFSSLVFESNPLEKGLLQTVAGKLNEKLERTAPKNAILVDLDMILAKTGVDNAFDARNFLSAKSLYTFDFFKSYVKMIKPAFNGITGKIKKVLILDCDNTLWGGIIGEDGFEGIQMSDLTPKGKAFREAQKIFLKLRRAGVLIAICSKNNPEEVDKVINEHPDFLLTDEDIVAKKVNWNNKATNIQQLATELNLGLDSFVFIDDSEFELGLVEKELPQVTCYRVPENISDYPAGIRDLGNLFYSPSKTNEDIKKTEMYRQEAIRKNAVAGFSSIDEYLGSLGLELTIMWNEQIPVERTAQLTQKTNQFNLTTRRYTENDIQKMISDGQYRVAAFSLADRYGDYGVTGVAIVSISGQEEKKATIDSLLMSCRVIGRNVEYAFFEQLRLKLLAENVSLIEAEYIATPKNHQVKEYYPKLGFTIVSGSEERMIYSRDTTLPLNIEGINYIKIITNE
jgi:FkbH-like protein